jgi:hypothetical protein
VQLKKARAAAANGANEETPLAAVSKLAMLNLDFALQRAFAHAKNKDNFLRVAAHHASGAQTGDAGRCRQFILKTSVHGTMIPHAAPTAEIGRDGRDDPGGVAVTTSMAAASVMR